MMPSLRTCCAALAVSLALACASCKPRTVYLQGQKTEYIRKGTPAPFDGFLIEKGRLYTLLRLAKENIDGKEKDEARDANP